MSGSEESPKSEPYQNNRCIEKLTAPPADYKNWSKDIRKLLESLDLVNLIDYSSSEEAKTKSNVTSKTEDISAQKLAKDWLSRDNRAQRIILDHVASDQRSRISEFNSAFKQWQYLKGIHKPSPSQLGPLLQDFYCYTPKSKTISADQLDIDLTKIEANIKLISKTEAPSEKAKAEIIKRVLGNKNPRFEPTILYLDNHPEKSYIEVLDQLRNTERRISDPATGESADSAQAKPTSGVVAFEQCWHCASKDHQKPDCLQWLATPECQTQKVERCNRSSAWNATAQPFECAPPTLATMPLAQGGTIDDNWLFGSGATCFVTGNRGCFSHMYDLGAPAVVRLADGRRRVAEEAGHISLGFAHPHRQMTISDVLYVPGLAVNLVSAAKLQDQGIVYIDRKRW